jgi:hypothetical protein
MGVDAANFGEIHQAAWAVAMEGIKLGRDTDGLTIALDQSLEIAKAGNPGAAANLIMSNAYEFAASPSNNVPEISGSYLELHGLYSEAIGAQPEIAQQAQPTLVSAPGPSGP